MQKGNRKVSVKDYKKIACIGRGTYAKVFLVKNNKDGKLYAMKVLKKKFVTQKHQQKHIMTEKQVLSNISHPFLVKLKSSFQDFKKLYFILQYCPGGQLFSLLAYKDKLTQEQSKFYSVQIILALQELHRHNIIYRDLKPQNIIIDKEGYIKLTDFGLSKIVESNKKAKSICGTSQYLAPQIIKNIGHGHQVDWWCLGCLIYQMLTGFPPFQSSDRYQLFEKILNEQPNLSKMSPQMTSLLKGLLEKDPKKIT